MTSPWGGPAIRQILIAPSLAAGAARDGAMIFARASCRERLRRAEEGIEYLRMWGGSVGPHSTAPTIAHRKMHRPQFAGAQNRGSRTIRLRWLVCHLYAIARRRRSRNRRRPASASSRDTPARFRYRRTPEAPAIAAKQHGYRDGFGASPGLCRSRCGCHRRRSGEPLLSRPFLPAWLGSVLRRRPANPSPGAGRYDLDRRGVPRNHRRALISPPAFAGSSRPLRFK